MSKQLLTINLDPKKADPVDVRETFELAPEELDPNFGVVKIDPAQNLYAILVTEEAARRISGRPRVQGPFANPRIETFGPPRKSE
jgi:hypothetical protein